MGTILKNCPRCGGPIKQIYRHPDYESLQHDLNYYGEFPSNHPLRKKIQEILKELRDESKQTQLWFLCPNCRNLHTGFPCVRETWIIRIPEQGS